METKQCKTTTESALRDAACSPPVESEAMRDFLQLHGWQPDNHEPIKTIISVMDKLGRERNQYRSLLSELCDACDGIDCADFMPAAMPDVYARARKFLLENA